jgi:type II secretory pathway component PulJ
MKSGYVLLEVIIASAIAAMLSTILLTSMTQLTRSTAAAYSLMSVDMRLMLFFKQFEHDISTAFVPRVKKEREEAQAAQTTTPASGQQQAQQSQRIELEPLPKSFIGKTVDGRLQELSFITTNPIPSYNIAKPRIMRVVYRLVQEPERKDSLRIMRYETPELSLQELPKESTQNFMLIDHVKDFKMEFVAYVQEPQQAASRPGQQQTQTGAQQPPPPKRKIVVQEWPSRDLEEQRANLIPDQVVVNMVLWDLNYKHETHVSYVIPIIAPEPVSTMTQQGGIQQQQTKPAASGAQGGAAPTQQQQQATTQQTNGKLRIVQRAPASRGVS